jgi:Amt family ammonium transporter
MGGGIWGTIACGLFRTGGSLFYGGDIRFFGIQVLGALVITAWSLITMGMFFALMAYLKIFRKCFLNFYNQTGVPETDELAGLDEKKHDGAAYSNKSWSQL